MYFGVSGILALMVLALIVFLAVLVVLAIFGTIAAVTWWNSKRPEPRGFPIEPLGQGDVHPPAANRKSDVGSERSK